MSWPARLMPWRQKALSAVCSHEACGFVRLEDDRACDLARAHVRTTGHTVTVSEERVRAVVPRA